jgi:hypothetical protein
MAPIELLTPTSYSRFTRRASRFPDILGVMRHRVSDVEPPSRLELVSGRPAECVNATLCRGEYSIAFRGNSHLGVRV